MRRVWVLLAVFAVAPVSSRAADYTTEVSNVQVNRTEHYYNFSADIDYYLSDQASQALQNGVSLFWIVRAKLQQVRPYLWDKTLADLTIRYRIQYHALLNMYRVRNETTNAVYNFSTLSAALNQMSAIRDIPLIEITELDAQQDYQVAVKVMLDRDALPLPLRPIAYANPEWYLSSDWTTWPLAK